MKTGTTAIFVLGLVLGSPVWAAQDAGPGPAVEPRADIVFKAIDSSGDGRVSKQEFMDAAARRAERTFQQMDSNGDGFITEEEGVQARETMRERFRERMERRRKAAPSEVE